MQVPLAPPEEFRAMSWETARSLEREGVDFGPHSISHRIFSRLSDADDWTELATSWQRLQAELKNPLPVFCWPTGRRADFGAREMALARELGLQAAVLTIPDFAHVRPESRTEDLFALKSVCAPGCRRFRIAVRILAGTRPPVAACQPNPEIRERKLERVAETSSCTPSRLRVARSAPGAFQPGAVVTAPR